MLYNCTHPTSTFSVVHVYYNLTFIAPNSLSWQWQVIIISWQYSLYNINQGIQYKVTNYYEQLILIIYLTINFLLIVKYCDKYYFSPQYFNDLLFLFRFS